MQQSTSQQVVAAAACHPDQDRHWHLLVVDDDESIHQATKFALDDFCFDDRQLKIHSAYSAAQARQLLAENLQPAVILLDVVMETETVGLELVDWIRKENGDHRVRIVLRTGQPGFAPELKVVRDYDINDYKEKADMTATKLATTLYAALRSFRDIQQLEQQQADLRKALNAAEVANKAKTNFISHMSHEFRTPLNGILGLSEIIASEMLGPVGVKKYKEYARDIVSSGQQLQQLIESVLMLSDFDSEREIDIAPFDLHELIDEFSNYADMKEAAANSVTVPRASEPLLLQADRKAVQTMIASLISNAIRHNPSECRVSISTRLLEDGALTLSVSDDGVGIRPEVVRQLGDAFLLPENPYVSSKGSLGLGLASTKRLIEAHGGSMTILNGVDGGTIVRLQFPQGSVMSAIHKAHKS
jgi:signal transduction histidine kinase